MMGTWIKQTGPETEPTWDDMPFLTWDGKNYELWEDSDWFHELDDDDRAKRTDWVKLIPPKKDE